MTIQPFKVDFLGGLLRDRERQRRIEAARVLRQKRNAKRLYDACLRATLSPVRYEGGIVSYELRDPPPFVPRPSNSGRQFNRQRHAIKRCGRFLKSKVGHVKPPTHLLELGTLLPTPSKRERLAKLLPGLGSPMKSPSCA